ncbi:butyrophilin-like protein 1 [Artibeus jamaicensis]|uniref:butyrophilin-like protein 1 n=1 Tax=Artibeus jamaicensis TaxID=9417 RepID=UPI00235AF5E7|nr:butyrophilin-like protein 1 [Artibeus jamaicensis]
MSTWVRGQALCSGRARPPAPKEMAGFPAGPAASLLPLLLLQVPAWCLAAPGFSVKGPAEPVVALLGADATLPCQLSPEQSTAHMHIRWYRAQLSPAVLVYQDGQEDGGEQMLEYRGRAELVADSISKGSVALLIRHIRATDNGQYRCYFKDGHVSQEATVELHVIGLGSVPHIHMTGPEDGGIRVLCSSGGWFPKPRLQWSDKAGAKLPSLSESHTQDGEGLFRTEASLVVTDSSLGNVTCSIQNPLSGQEKVATIFLPEPFFPKMCPWKAALAGTLPVLALLLAGISYTGWREHQAKEREVEKRKKESHERDQMKSEKEMVLNAKENLTTELERRKKLYAADWKKALLYPDWRKEQFKLAPVTVNHKHFCQNNSDPERKENLGEETQDLCRSEKQGDQNLITLHEEGFTSGRHYWEVDVEDTCEWTLGIYEERKDSSGLLQALLKKTFRVLEKKGCEYRALACSPQDISLERLLGIEMCPKKIGIFVDYEDSDISFYNMTDGAHIFSFTRARFSGSLYPYFKESSWSFLHPLNSE